MDTQTLIAIVIVVAAALWATKLLVGPLIASFRPQKPGRCAGGCGCGHEDRNSLPESGKADACATPGPNLQKSSTQTK